MLVTALDGFSHLVGERAFATSSDGRFPARCGASIVSTSLAENPWSICPLCVPQRVTARGL